MSLTAAGSQKHYTMQSRLVKLLTGNYRLAACRFALLGYTRIKLFSHCVAVPNTV